MTTTIDSKTDVYSRPNARFGDDGTLEIRASAVGNCRRALWYEANEYPVTNARTEESFTMLEAGNALEPVVLRAMRRAGWDITPTDRDNPEMVSLRLGPTLVVTGHVDATGVVPIFGDEPSVIEIKTRDRKPRTIAKSGSSSVEPGDGLRWAEGAAFGSQGHGHLGRKPSLEAQGIQCRVDQGGECLAQTGSAQGVNVLIPAAVLHMMLAVLNAPVVAEQLEQPSGPTLT